ncbi:hypothetical protein ACIBCH_24650 [Amycolatopsis thailandensis]|uniref:hypothetical protein n=1 Tax=Amycolatopsis thailandensis TaxID=589330 RepID=UPI00142D9050|nr:hypothetical protein [Amycolatopsis thailandensis]
MGVFLSVRALLKLIAISSVVLTATFLLLTLPFGDSGETVTVPACKADVSVLANV